MTSLSWMFFISSRCIASTLSLYAGSSARLIVSSRSVAMIKEHSRRDAALFVEPFGERKFRCLDGFRIEPSCEHGGLAGGTLVLQHLDETSSVQLRSYLQTQQLHQGGIKINEFDKCIGVANV